LYINQHKIIFYRNGYSLLANVSGTSKSIILNDIDLFVLGHIAKNENADDIMQIILADPVLNTLFPNVSEQQINSRFVQYKEVEAIVDKPSLNPPEVSFEVFVENTHPLESDRPEPQLRELRLSTHFGIVPTPQGYAAWSVPQNGFLALSVVEVILLLAFGDGKSVANVMAEKANLQLSVDTRTTMLKKFTDAAWLTSMKDKVEGTEPVLIPFNAITEHSLGHATDWQALPKSNKIPVYFVPHMENHFPLALGVLYSALVAYKNAELLQRFQFIPLNYLAPQALFDGPYRKFGPGVWLFSNYMWSIDVNMQISHFVKQHNKVNLMIHGGPSTPNYQQACEDFMTEHRSVDAAVHGEGEVTITEIFDCIDASVNRQLTTNILQLAKVAGLTYREPMTGRLMRTGPRERMKSPDDVPSSYLNGLFDGYNGRIEAAIIETNRGCPYGCTFCDWGSATNQKIRKFDLQRVIDEITWIGKNKIRVMWIADANYGLYDRDIEISQFIVDIKRKYGYPQEIVVNYTKNSTWRLVEIIKIFTEGGIIGQGIISIQTTDEKTLEVINRKNIKTQRYDELAQAFTDLNLPLSTDLMIGLPGMTIQSFMADLQRYIDMDVSVKAYPTQLLPNSPMAEPGYMQKYEIKADEHNFLISTYSYTQADIQRMKKLYEVYVMADGYSLLRYVIRFMQWEYAINASTFIENLLDDCVTEPNAYPLLTWAVHFFNQDKSMPSGWTAFYQQLKDYIVARYQVADNSTLNTIIKVSQATMPDDAQNYPISLNLAHDFHAYFRQNKESFKALHTFAQSTMVFSDPNRLSNVDLNSAQYDSHQYFWELYSSVARPKSLAEFAA
jgi:radical SAM superfamily enzyme YgiQ (UPF0313 family)